MSDVTHTYLFEQLYKFHVSWFYLSKTKSTLGRAGHVGMIMSSLNPRSKYTHPYLCCITFYLNLGLKLIENVSFPILKNVLAQGECSDEQPAVHRP